mmetsp:Transcript_26904/g.19358  ORF Transcript_26904/g.19358 Transcript_26904/m.19358 type:complete len:91 (-) Transcript_26904:1320-1592(-)
MYTIDTKPLKWKASRKDGDFYVLRKVLLKNYPHQLIPPLPPKTNKQTHKVIMKRERYFTRFLNGVCRCEELKSSPFLVEFLKNNDLKQWM